MKKSILALTLVSLSAFSISSCQKKDDTAPDASKVTITTISPQDGQIIYQGDTLHMDATVSYPSELHGYEVELTDSATGTILFSTDDHVHSDHFEIHETWVDTFSTPATLQLKITVEIDHDGHEGSKTIKLYSKPTSGMATMKFANVAGSQSLVLNTGNYTTTGGDNIIISKFNYYISNVRFNNTNGGSYAEANSYHLVQQNVASSQSFNVGDIPVGTYNSVTFMIGVDSLRNVSGAQTGALDPANGMFWSWNTGYIMAKMEGTSPQSGATDKSFIFHIGGFSGANKGVRTITLNLPSPLVVGKNSVSTINLHADALAWFQPNNINLSTVYNLMAVDANSKKIADNYAGMFGVDAVNN